MSSPILPFIFARLTEESQENTDFGSTPVIKDWMVKIAVHIDFKVYDSRWMDDAELGKYCLVPDVDISETQYVFSTFDEARDFVKEWWKNN